MPLPKATLLRIALESTIIAGSAKLAAFIRPLNGSPARQSLLASQLIAFLAWGLVLTNSRTALATFIKCWNFEMLPASQASSANSQAANSGSAG